MRVVTWADTHIDRHTLQAKHFQENRQVIKNFHKGIMYLYNKIG